MKETIPTELSVVVGSSNVGDDATMTWSSCDDEPRALLVALSVLVAEARE